MLRFLACVLVLLASCATVDDLERVHDAQREAEARILAAVDRLEPAKAAELRAIVAPALERARTTTASVAIEAAARGDDLEGALLGPGGVVSALVTGAGMVALHLYRNRTRRTDPTVSNLARPRSRARARGIDSGA